VIRGRAQRALTLQRAAEIEKEDKRERSKQLSEGAFGRPTSGRAEEEYKGDDLLPGIPAHLREARYEEGPSKGPPGEYGLPKRGWRSNTGTGNKE
jgi:hypothetical protein